MYCLAHALDADIPLQQAALTVATANLCERFGLDLDLLQVHVALTDGVPAGLDWHSLERLGLQPSTIEHGESFPTEAHSLVMYRRMDQRLGTIIDHPCLVADIQGQRIIDTLDGVEKDASVYGTPHGWASYTLSEPAELARTSASTPDRLYKLLPGQSFWDAQRVLNIPSQELLEHNGYDKPDDVPSEATLHLPEPRALPETSDIQYEDINQLYHVSHPGGTRKYTFGNVKQLSDVQPTGRTYKHGQEVTITKAARVPTHDADTPQIVLLMDDTPGNFLAGFNHSHLTPGPAPDELEVALAEATADKAGPVVEPEVAHTNDKDLPAHTISRTVQSDPVIHATEAYHIPVESQAMDMVVPRIRAQRCALQPRTVPHAAPEPQPEDDSDFALPNLHERLQRGIDPHTNKRTSGGRLEPHERYLILPAFTVWANYRKLTTRLSFKRNK